MALCSQAFNPNKRRSCGSFEGLPSDKRVCLKNVSFRYPQTAMYFSSSEDDDSDDEQSCYNADQIRAKRRASTRVSFSLNSDLSKAVSKYSDEDEQDEVRLRKSEDEATCDDKPAFFFEEPVEEITNNAGSTNVGAPANQKNSSDKAARSRCFEYLVGSIDEAWARYCDAATNVEDEVYGYNTPASVATDDEDYLDNPTDITDYDTDFDDKKTFRPRLSSSASYASFSSTREDPSSCQLQALKDRLTKAKYYLQDLVDSDDAYDINAFWKRWDMIKYATIELVEDDDDDEVVEGMIDELERGRC